MPLKMYKESLNKVGIQSVSSIFAIAAGKGGVGKSTMTALLARSLSKRGKKVGILDADIYGASLCEILQAPALKVSEEGVIYPAEVDGIKIVSMAHFKQKHDPFIARAPFVISAIENFLYKVNWGDLDILLIDFPPGTGDIHITLAQKAPITAALLVTTPQELSLSQVSKTAHLFHKLRIPFLGIIENMSYYCSPSQETLFPFGRDGGKRLSSLLNIPCLDHIPLDSGIEKKYFEFKSVCQAIEKKTFHFPKENLELESVRFLDKNLLEFLWNDGVRSICTAQKICEACPCAGCQESEERTSLKAAEIREVVRVGRYALRFIFTEGCQKGIYDFSLLRSL